MRLRLPRITMPSKGASRRNRRRSQMGHYRAHLLAEMLEDRRLLSIDAGWDGNTLLPVPSSAESSYSMVDVATTPAPLRVVLISDAVAQAEEVRMAAVEDLLAVIYQSDTMTTARLADLISSISVTHGGARVGQLGIMAHGGAGQVNIGKDDQLTLTTMSGQTAQLKEIRSVLTPDARLDLYSCNVASGVTGKAFVNQLAAATGTVVYASDNPVGSGAAGDFVWEYQTGRVVSNSQLFSIQGLESIEELSLAETQANGSSAQTAISADGRYVAFRSAATNLVPGDTIGGWNIFVRDMQNGTTTRVSVADNGTEANANCDEPSISADGRYVAFSSSASTLVSGDTNGESDVFVRDLQNGTTTRVSVADDETQGNGGSGSPSISADGRYVAFRSHASLASGDTGWEDIYVRDTTNGTTTRVSVGVVSLVRVFSEFLTRNRQAGAGKLVGQRHFGRRYRS